MEQSGYINPTNPNFNNIGDIQWAVLYYLNRPFPSEGIEKALRDFLEKLDDEVLRRILPGWRRPVTLTEVIQNDRQQQQSQELHQSQPQPSQQHSQPQQNRPQIQQQQSQQPQIQQTHSQQGPPQLSQQHSQSQHSGQQSRPQHSQEQQQSQRQIQQGQQNQRSRSRRPHSQQRQIQQQRQSQQEQSQQEQSQQEQSQQQSQQPQPQGQQSPGEKRRRQHQPQSQQPFGKRLRRPQKDNSYNPYELFDGDTGNIVQRVIAYLNEKQLGRPTHNGNARSNVNETFVRGAVEQILSGYLWHIDEKNKIGDLWAEESIITSEKFKDRSHSEHLVILYNLSVSSAFSNEFKRRILVLLMNHERKQIRTSASDRAISDSANGWLRWMECWGFGGLLLPGPGYQSAFENGLSSSNVKDLWDFFDQNLPDITVRVRQIHETGICLFDKAMVISKGDINTLQFGGGSLANAYRIHKGILEVSTLTTPFIATTSGANLNPTMPVDADTLAEAESQSHFSSVPNDGMNTLIQLPVPHGRLGNNAGVVFSDGDVPASGPSELASNPEVLYREAVQPYPQQTAPQYDPFCSAQSQQYEFNHMSTGGRNLSSEWWPVAGPYSSLETGGVYDSTTGIWDQTMERLYQENGW